MGEKGDNDARNAMGTHILRGANFLHCGHEGAAGGATEAPRTQQCGRIQSSTIFYQKMPYHTTIHHVILELRIEKKPRQTGLGFRMTFSPRA